VSITVAAALQMILIDWLTLYEIFNQGTLKSREWKSRRRKSMENEGFKMCL